MRIGIDARFIRSAGVERYYNELIRHLSLIDDENQYVIYYPSIDYLNRHKTKKHNFRSHVLPAPVFGVKEHLLLNYRIIKDKLDVFHATNYWVVPVAGPCPIVATAHDACYKSHPELITSQARIYASFMLPYALKKSSVIITVSEFSRKEIIRYFPETQKKLIVTYNGINNKFHPVNDSDRISEVKNKYSLNGRYILYVGSIKKNKNIMLLIKAFKMLAPELKKKHRLLIAGKPVPGCERDYEEAKNISKDENISFTGFIEDEDLPAIYAGSTAFVFPSHYEGFGIPLVEAMACGVPVLTSNIPVMSEVCGKGALYFDPYSADELKHLIERVIVDNDLRESLSKEGLEQSKKFSWKATAEKTLEVYMKVYAEKGRCS